MRATQTATRSGGGSDGDLLVQRCSCGKSGKSAEGMCEECREKQTPGLGVQAKLIVGAAGDPFEREADRAAAAVIGARAPALTSGPVAQVRRRADASAGARLAPASVARTIGGAGEPLSQSARSYFEPRFGHDFGRVRVHRDAAAASSARDIAARAYTVGHHVVFGAGGYAPESRPGRTLIAHELAHVIQQTGRVQRSSISPVPTGHGSAEEEEEELQTATPVEQEEEAAGAVGTVQRMPIDDMFLDIDDPFPEKTESDAIRAEAKAQEECVKNTPPDPLQCDPNRLLDWADFTGTPDYSLTYGAVCHTGLRKRATNTALLKCMPDTAAGQKANAEGIQAYFDGAQSWVKPRPKNPRNNAVNGCQGVIDRCKSQLAAAGSGAWWALKTDQDPKCAASPRPRGDRATSQAACETVVGKDCADQAAADASRLLEHERGHFLLTCALARKANAMIDKTTDVDKLLTAAKKVRTEQQKLYDDESEHGCNAANQATWDIAIEDGLPGVDIKVGP